MGFGMDIGISNIIGAVGAFIILGIFLVKGKSEVAGAPADA